MHERRLTQVDEEALRAEIAAAAEKFRRDYCPGMSAGAAVVRPWLDRMYAMATSRDVPLEQSPRRSPPNEAGAFLRPPRAASHSGA